MLVFTYRLTGIAFALFFRWPKQIIGLGVVIFILAGIALGLDALAQASGLGLGFYLILGGSTAAVLLLIRTKQSREKARRYAAESIKMDIWLKYDKLVTGWELGEIEPSVVVAEVATMRADRIANGVSNAEFTWEARMLQEAEGTVAKGRATKRDRRVRKYSRQWEEVGLAVSRKYFDHSWGEMQH